MSEVSETADEETVAPVPSRRPSKKLLIIGGAVLLLLVAAAVGAWLFFGSSDKPEHSAGEASTASEGGEEGEVFVEVPPMVVNLRSSDGAPRLIKIRLTLVPESPEKAPAITAKLPLIIDSFQPFLRELRPEDLAGSAAIFRIKEELLIRSNAVAGSGTVKQVLVQDLLQQ